MNSQLQTALELAPDPALPQRDDLLDDVLVGARLHELFEGASAGVQMTECMRLRAKYRMGESLRATYRIVDDNGSRLVSARMFTVDKAARQLARAREAALSAGVPPHSVLLDESMSTVFWVFPQDRKLHGLGQLTCPPASLREVFGEPWVHSELMAYMPEKSATARCSDESGVTVGFAKMQIGDEGRRSVSVLRAARRGLAEQGLLQLPDVIGYLPERHLALFSPAPGLPLHQVDRAAVPDAMAALGAALSVLHRQPTEGFAPFTRLRPDSVAHAGRLVDAARPDLAPLTQKLVGSLLSTPRASGPRVLLHGDLHPKNVLVHDAGVSLVDLDQAGVGPAAAELGGTLARLWCPRPGDEIEPGRAAAAADVLLDSYDHPPPYDDLLWHAAAALLVERAARAVGRVDGAVMADLDRVLATALRWAGQAAGDRR